MPSDLFSEYARSSAFRIDLSGRMIDALLDVAGLKEDSSNLNLLPYRAIQRRGLVEWSKNGPALTEAGALVVQLLQIAGYVERDTQPSEEG